MELPAQHGAALAVARLAEHIELPRDAGPHGQTGFVQITLAGTGRVETTAGVQAVPRGTCLLTNLDHHMTFAGRSAHCPVEDLVAAHGHVLAIDPDGPVVRGMLDRAGDVGIRAAQLDAGTATRLAGEVLLHLAEVNAPWLDADDALVHRATAMLAADLADPPAVAAVAHELGVSREHLTRLFRGRLGIPPGRWLRDERQRHAELLLRSTDLPMAAVGAQVGYRSPSAFISAFRAARGCTPRVYRRGD